MESWSEAVLAADAKMVRSASEAALLIAFQDGNTPSLTLQVYRLATATEYIGVSNVTES